MLDRLTLYFSFDHLCHLSYSWLGQLTGLVLFKQPLCDCCNVAENCAISSAFSAMHACYLCKCLYLAVFIMCGALVQAKGVSFYIRVCCGLGMYRCYVTFYTLVVLFYPVAVSVLT